MDENLRNAMVDGIEAETICTVTDQNLNKGYFPPQAARYYDEMCNFINEDPTVPFSNKLRFLLTNGISSEQIRNYFNKNITTMEPERINFVARSISSTSKYQRNLKSRENARSLVYKNQYPNNNWHE